MTLSSSTPPTARVTLLAIVLAAGCSSAPARAESVGPSTHAKALAATRAPGSAGRAPSGPPLIQANAAPGASRGTSDGGDAPPGEADPLVSNGLGSPLCTGALGWQELPAASARHCGTSGFVAAAAPTGDYGVDVHIDTGFLGLSYGKLLSLVQDLFVAPLWMALVWAVHALVVMLEWCFTIDLLDSPAIRDGVSGGLRRMQRAFTEPWLTLAFACASVLAVYNGLVRRRVTETVGQAFLLVAMTAAGMWVMLDPVGTVGAVGGWANQASLGTLAVTARGQPSGAGRALAEGMSTVFAAAVEVPWCYLEFGDVSWCRDPSRLDPTLRAAALRIAADELPLARCAPGAAGRRCASDAGSQARGLAHSAQLLQEARTNGAIFLALPANGPQRNSINDSGSLLRAMCQSSEATQCHGPMAAQAEFRTDHGTWPRVGGLLLIVAGVLGMLLLLGFIAIRLIGAALFSLFYLLLTPAAVIAPALGDTGRAVFRRWAAQLLGAVVAKLLFSFLLGVVLAVIGILAALRALGWWTQWLLMCAFWWGAFARRHQALALAGGAVHREPLGTTRTVRARVHDALHLRRTLREQRRARIEREAPPPATAESAIARGTGLPGGDRPGELADALHDRGQTDRAVASGAPAQGRGHIPTAAEGERADDANGQLRVWGRQLERVLAEHERALADGDRRRAAELGHRAGRIRGDIERERRRLSGEASSGGAQPRRTAQIPGAAARGGASSRGSHADILRATRRELDRELDEQSARRRAGAGRPAHQADRGSVVQPPRKLPPREPQGAAGGTDAVDRPSRSAESSVMRDAREVEARRKRQLGLGRD